MAADASTPLMRQYNSVKEQVSGALLLFRLGDFYELFFEDAVIAARDLEITLTSRNKEKGAAIPMCGVPYHAAEGYISRLIQKGHRVAICEQMEDPKVAKKLVKREITRVVTPGTAMDANLDRPTYYDRADSMILDAVTVRNLELIEPLFAADAGGPHTQPTVLGVLDQTLTGMGGRLLRQRLLRPGMDRGEIEQRLDAVGELQQQTILRAELRKQLSGILDLERLLARVTLGSAGPRDVLALGRSIERI